MGNSVSSTAVLAVLEAFEHAAVDASVAGGWAIDAVVGEETRVHRDLDLAVRADHLDRAIVILEDLGYHVGADLRPVRLVMSGPDGGSVDLHPVTFGADGVGWQADDAGGRFEYPRDAFGTGLIGGIVIPCLTAEQLVRFHLGYEPLDHDRRDMELLRKRLGIDVPPPY
jgi:lincosamide nucleotidyltransferase A/C/D/E